MSDRLLAWMSCLLALLLVASPALALYDGMYCGKINCYDLLNITRETPKKDLGKVCRTVLREYHPDKNAKVSESDWNLYRTACETLRDDESRKNYDYLLDNPDEFYRHWWYYHRPRVSTQIDAGLVIIVLLTLISGLQYYFINDSYRRQIKTILEYDDKLLTKLVNRAEQEGRVDRVKDKKGKMLPKEVQKEALYELYGDEMGLDANLDRCYWHDVAWMKVLRGLYKWPLVLYRWGNWYYRRYTGCEYNQDEKEYLTRFKLMISERNWNKHTQEYRDDLIAKELWDEEKYRQYQDEQEEKFAEYVLREADFKRYKKEKKKTR